MPEITKGRYRHYKGKDYLVIGEATYSETESRWFSMSHSTEILE